MDPILYLPREGEQLKHAIDTLEELNYLRMQAVTEAAERTQNLKTMGLMAEESRLINDM
jgi:hypothetical protein